MRPNSLRFFVLVVRSEKRSLYPSILLVSGIERRQGRTRTFLMWNTFLKWYYHHSMKPSAITLGHSCLSFNGAVSSRKIFYLNSMSTKAV
jgi:hypothetical protein